MESLVLNTFDFLFNGIRPIIYVEIHAAVRGNQIQNYIDNPHWTWPENGGFDFNKLKKLNYKIFNFESELDVSQDWNPKEGSHHSVLLIPS